MRTLKLISLIVLAIVLSLAGIQHHAYANRIGNLPTSQAGQFNTFTYDFSSGITAIHNGTAITSPDGGTTYVPQVTSIGAGTMLYGFSVYSDSAGGTAAIYDASTVGSISATVSTATTSYVNAIVDEIGEATQYDTAYSDWISPRKLSTGFTMVSVNNPNVCVYYGRQND